MLSSEGEVSIHMFTPSFVVLYEISAPGSISMSRKVMQSSESTSASPGPREKGHMTSMEY